ncbi:MAG: pyridoxamine 5'-phosphate oxidase [Planctomycetota bacterium]
MSSIEETYSTERSLPDELPASPWGLFTEWWDAAHGRAERDGQGPIQRNPNAMTLATADADGTPSARVVLCKGMDLDLGHIVFYTNRNSQKGRELGGNPRAALVFHWDNLDLQARIAGPVTPSPDAESDAYFVTRPLESRLGAWGSRQSEPLDSRDTLIEQVAEAAISLGVQLDDESAEIPRPPHWGGFRVWAERVELWCAGIGRVHDRARWTRSLEPATVDTVAGYQSTSEWSATRLNP